jgi:hypothetical protein
MGARPCGYPNHNYYQRAEGDDWEFLTKTFAGNVSAVTHTKLCVQCRVSGRFQGEGMREIWKNLVVSDQGLGFAPRKIQGRF